MDEEKHTFYTFKLDLEKFSTLTHAEFILRLMMAINDLQSIYHLAGLLEADKENSHRQIHLGATGFMLKIQSSILAEAITTFVKSFPTQGKDSLHVFNQKSKKRKELWARLVKGANDPKFKEMMELRNKFGFHYDHEGYGPRTKEALLELIKAQCAQAKSFGSIFDSSPSSPASFRYILADEVLYVAWSNIHGKLSTEAENGKSVSTVESLKTYIVALGSSFVTWGLDLVFLWIKENDLMTAFEKEETI